MPHPTPGIDRRTMVSQAAGLALLAAGGAAMMKQQAQAGTPGTPGTTGTEGTVTGKGVGDFDFLAGEWRIQHRRLKDGTSDEWQHFVSGATVHRVLGGMGSIEELRKPDGSFMGMGVRVWLPEQAQWADHWTSAGNGVVNPPQLGRFIDGAGVFITEETVDGVRMLHRGVWDRITPDSCRWHQSSSRDLGKTWQWNWWMDWTRAR